jgi:hypothetical protein
MAEKKIPIKTFNQKTDESNSFTELKKPIKIIAVLINPKSEGDKYTTKTNKVIYCRTILIILENDAHFTLVTTWLLTLILVT